MNRTPPWGSLPAPALANIYEYLKYKDLLKASSTCWHWRSVLFQKRFFKNFKFKLNIGNDQCCKFFIRHLLHLTSELTVIFELFKNHHIERITRILRTIAKKGHVIVLRFETSSVGFAISREYYEDDECPIDDIKEVFVEPIKKLLNRKLPSVQVLDLGAIEYLAYYAIDFLNALARPQDLREFTIASVKFDPNYYPILTVEHEFFEKLTSLQVLSLDYDTLNDDVLKTLQILPLKKFMICVHGLNEQQPLVSEEAWAAFASKLKNIKLILTLIYSYQTVKSLDHRILRRNMPITHLRVLFCNYINVEALDLISQLYKNTLKSIYWVDSPYNEMDQNIMDLFLGTPQDPFVMLAWLCKHLEEIVIHGYYIDPYNLVGISRLRGRNLKKLEVLLLDGNPESYWDPFIKEISAQLEQKWLPLNPTKVHPPPVDDRDFYVDDEYVLELIRSDLAN